MHREALTLRKLFREQDPEVADSLNDLAATLLAQGKTGEAESALREVISVAKNSNNRSSSDFVLPFNNLSELLLQRGAVAEAEAVFRDRAYVLYSLAGTNGDLLGTAGTIKMSASSPELDSPTKAGYLELRAFLLGRHGQWQAAANDFSEACKLDPGFPAFALGPLLVEIGDTPGYRAFRRRLLARFNFTEDPQTGAEAVMGMSLRPAESEYSPPSRLVEAIVTQDTNDVRQAYFQLVRALAEYRQGRFSSAEQWSKRSLSARAAKQVTAVAASAVQAMAQQQLKRPDEPRKTLAEAVELAQAKLPRLESGDLGEDWPEWLIAHILLREAKLVLDGGAQASDELK